MLTALRNSAQSWLIKLLLGIIVITFVISFGIGTFSNPKEVLVTVDSEEIMVSQFLRQYQQELDRLRQRFPDNAEVLANQLNLREQVMNRMVNRSLILRAAQRHGFQVTEEEVQASVTGQPAFQVNGNFDFDTYRQILSQNNLTPSAYEEQLRDDLLVSKVQRSLTAGVIVGDPQVEQRYRVENEKVEVDYLFVDPARFSLPTPPGEEQVRAYYEKHPEAFTQPERFGLHYFLLGLPQLEKEVEVQPRAVERYYERNVESEFSTPTKVRASHILKRLPADATPEQVANARKAMEGILAKVKAGEDFARLARAQSEDFSKEKGGDLGLFSRDEMVPAFADAAFALPKGGISEVVRTQFGLHIIQVTDIEQGVRKPLEAVHAEIEASLRARRAERRLELELERLPLRIAKEGLEAVAKSLGVPVENSGLFDGSMVNAGLGSTGPLYNQLKGKKKNATGVWKRNPVLGHVFYQVVEKQDATVRPLPEVIREATRLASEELKREASLAEAKQVFQKLKEAESFTAYAKRRKLEVKQAAFTIVAPSIEGLGVNREFQRSAFRLGEGEPFALNIKDGRAYLLRFKRRTLPPPDQAAELKKQVRGRLEETLQNFVVENEINRLRSQVKIDVQAPEYLMTTAPTTPRRG